MHIGIPRELMNSEGRVALSPDGAKVLADAGHTVLVETGAGQSSSMPDGEYRDAGAQLVDDAADVWRDSELVLKVKEPLEGEYRYLREDLMLFTYLHLAASRPVTEALLDSGVTSIAYETITDSDGGLPLLTPMSQAAGRLAVMEGAHHLLSPMGGRGVLLPGVPGTLSGKVAVLGGGQVGASAVAMALGLRAEVTVLDLDPKVLQRFDDLYQGRVKTLVSSPQSVEEALLDADLVIGAVLVAGAKTPVLVPDSLVARMKSGAVLVDVAVDQGGCFESSHPTSHDRPTFKVADAIFYCVPNMPGAAANTTTRALTTATLPFIRTVAEVGFDAAVEKHPGLGDGLMTRGGQLHSRAVAEAHGLPHAER